MSTEPGPDCARMRGITVASVNERHRGNPPTPTKATATATATATGAATAWATQLRRLWEDMVPPQKGSSTDTLRRLPGEAPAEAGQ